MCGCLNTPKFAFPVIFSVLLDSVPMCSTPAGIVRPVVGECVPVLPACLEIACLQEPLAPLLVQSLTSIVCKQAFDIPDRFPFCVNRLHVFLFFPFSCKDINFFFFFRVCLVRR